MRARVDEVLAYDVPADTTTLDDDLVDAGFTRTLLPSQRDAVAQLVRAGGGGNFSVPGSGKTTMAYAVFALLREAGIVDRMLVIAPQSAYEAWTVEARDCFDGAWSPTVAVTPPTIARRADVLVLNYDRAATGANRAAIDTWSHGHRFLVVFDEAHRAKRGAAGAHGRGALDISTLATARLVLTGTPMPNGPEDLTAILDLAWPGQGARLTDPLTAHADRAWVRVTKDELQLERADVVVQSVDLDPAHRRIYDALMVDALDLSDEHQELANRAVMRMISAASNPALLARGTDQAAELAWPEDLPHDVDLDALLSDIAGLTLPAKLLAAAAHADEHAAAGRKLLVWTNFIGNVDELARVLAPHKPAVVTGRTALYDPAAPTDRERELRRFREDPACMVLIATPQTLGEGISLHKVCQSQLHVDRTFNAGLYLQSLDRTHRVGMPDGTTAHVTVLVARGTIDERIDDALRKKLKDMDRVLLDPTLSRLARVREASADDLPDRKSTRQLLAHLRAPA
ncbi:SNF2-related protein [Microbacterium maritypicum]